MKKDYSIQVDEECAGKRLDRAISDMTELSRSALKTHLTSLLVNGKEEKLSYKCREGDEIEILLEWEELELKAEDISLDIIYEDDNYIVINKPYGMVVHPAAGNFSGTVVNALMGMKKELSTGDDIDEFRPGIVHRLDKETSGLLIVAKNIRAHAYLGELFKERQITKRYRALVKGFYTPSKHTIVNKIGRDCHNRKKMAVVEGRGRESITEVEVLKHYSNYSYLTINLKTGRTHQIRVHLSNHGYPVLGDTIYSRVDRNFKDIPLCLVAYKLEFFDKFSNKTLKFRIDVPEHFKEVFKQLESDEL